MGKHVARTEWTREQKQQAAMQYAIEGSLVKIERDQGIPNQTLSDWKCNDPEWVETVGNFREENDDRALALSMQIVEKAQQQTLDKLPEASAAQASIIAATHIDKGRLIRNKATSISSQDNRELAEVCKELSRTMRDHKVVATQNKTTD